MIIKKQLWKRSFFMRAITVVITCPNCKKEIEMKYDSPDDFSCSYCIQEFNIREARHELIKLNLRINKVLRKIPRKIKVKKINKDKSGCPVVGMEIKNK